MDIVGDKRGVMHIMVHVGNQRIVNEGVDIGGVVDVVIDKGGVMHHLCDKGGVMDIDGIVNKNGITLYNKVGDNCCVCTDD